MMNRLTPTLVFVLGAFLLIPALALQNGVGKLPTLGYNTWYAYQCNIDEDLILTDAKLIKSFGLLDAGYNYINLDDCYAERNRSASGNIIEDQVRFRRDIFSSSSICSKTGIVRYQYISANVHTDSVQQYSDSGWFTCAGYPGSFQNELRDARTFQDWGFDYLKYDNCAIPFDNIIREGIVGKYKRMADALEELSATSGHHPFTFALCQWGWVECMAVNGGNSSATAGDNSFITQATDFYGHNDLDILQLGNGDLTFDEAKSHFTAWALMKSPLLISANMSTITNETLEILTNREILAINQDPVVGTSISPFRWGINPDWTSNSSFPAQYWSGQSQNGTVFMLLNTLNEPSDLTFNLTESPWIRAGHMGYNTWNAFHCKINETVVAEAAVRMKTLHLTDFGYEFVNIDDCYSEKQRNKDGDIVADPVRFPSGMRNLTDFIRTLGLKSGIYSDAGWYTCAGYPGSFQNERRDIKLFQDWGFEFLKYDNCAVPFDEIVREGIVGKYDRMAQAIRDLSEETGMPPFIFSLCQWGKVIMSSSIAQPWLWARNMGQSWRTTGDIEPRWDSITSIINRNSFISWASDFYGHNDMDMLEVGNGNLTYEESKSHFTAWALMKSPLLIVIINSDLLSLILPDRMLFLFRELMCLNAASEETLEILTNKEIISINQDDVVGTAITPFRWGVNPDWTFNDRYPAQYWSGRTENGTVFMLLNVLDEAADMFFTLTESPWIRAGRQYAMRDLWTHTDNGTAVRNVTIHGVPAHGVVALLLRDAGDEPEGTQPPCAQPDWCMDKNGTLIEREREL
ncbi:hypothetical protein EYR36_002423 [Pleurotus pulmonarius]|nr:hypothetical protein EYR36_002423 [Pleurotus pulmonarius]